MNIQAWRRITVNVDEGAAREELGVLSGADAQSVAFEVKPRHATGGMDLIGASAVLYVLRADGQTVVGQAQVDEAAGTVTAALPEAAYRVPGRIAAALCVTQDEVRHTILTAEGSVRCVSSERTLDPEGMVPSLDALLARLGQMDAASEMARQAGRQAGDAAMMVLGAAQSVESRLCMLEKDVYAENKYVWEQEQFDYTAIGSSGFPLGWRGGCFLAETGESQQLADWIRTRAAIPMEGVGRIRVKAGAHTACAVVIFSAAPSMGNGADNSAIFVERRDIPAGGVWAAERENGRVYLLCSNQAYSAMNQDELPELTLMRSKGEVAVRQEMSVCVETLRKILAEGELTIMSTPKEPGAPVRYAYSLPEVEGVFAVEGFTPGLNGNAGFVFRRTEHSLLLETDLDRHALESSEALCLSAKRNPARG